MEEIWKEYKTYGHNYNGVTWIRSDIQISNFGNVKGNKWNEKSFNENMIKINSKGRRCLGTYQNSIYLLVWEVFNGPVPEGYCIHHKDHNKLNDRLDNLELMTKAEHAKHHSTGKKCSAETKEKIRNSNLNKPVSEETKQKLSESLKGHKNCLGYHQSEEHKRKQSESKKGRQFWNNGSINVFTRECPDGFRAGRIKKT